jgi:hypothetical protein
VDANFSKIPRETRSFGDDVVEVGNQAYGSAHLPGAQFTLYDVAAQSFYRKYLPVEIRNQDLIFASLRGVATDTYISWCEQMADDSESHPYEKGLIALLRSLPPCTIMLSSINDNMDEIVAADGNGMIQLLRKNLRSLCDARGFFANFLAEDRR